VENEAKFRSRYYIKYDFFFTEPIFTKLTIARQLCVRNCYTEFHENPTSDFVPDTMFKTCRRTDGRSEGWGGGLVNICAPFPTP
jgi:hypothetical protein